MRKINWLVGSISLGIGIAIGVLGIALASSPTAPSLLAKMHLGTANGGVITTGGSQNPAAPVAAPFVAGQDGSAVSPNGEQLLPPEPAATAGTDLNGENPSASGPDSSFSSAQANKELKEGSEGISRILAQQIIGDYKQDIGFFFDAWKSADMTAFRSKLTRAYSGELLERHARQAEEYILQGVGLDVSNISFDNVVVEEAGAYTATLRADYRYTASDFILSEGKTVGTPIEHVVHVRVNLIKSGQRWLITGETILD